MIFHPPILALLLASLISGLTLIWAAWFATRILHHWQLDSGHARQIALEKQTYLVSTALRFVLIIELASLLLFVANADRMAVMFVGAMCAVGSLTMNDFGLPALMLKLALFFAALVWLIINAIDNRARNYPFTRLKYGLLVGLAPLVLAASIVQFLYFFNLDANVITSCCSLLFTPEGTGVESDLASLPPGLALILLYGGFGVLVFLALAALRWRIAQIAYGLASLFFLIVTVAAIISVISPYVYEQPHRHCPFLLLKWQYDYIGYALYLPLFAATGLGLATGLLALRPAPHSPGLELGKVLRNQIIASVLLYTAFIAVTLFTIWNSHLILF